MTLSVREGEDEEMDLVMMSGCDSTDQVQAVSTQRFPSLFSRSCSGLCSAESRESPDLNRGGEWDQLAGGGSSCKAASTKHKAGSLEASTKSISRLRVALARRPY